MTFGLKTACVAAIVSLNAIGIARAGDPFLISATTTSGTPETISASGSNLPDLVSHFIKGQSQFSSLQDRNAMATLKYGSLNDAAIITKNAGNTSATLTLPTIGYTKAFTANNQDGLSSQIRKWAEKNGANVYGEFIRSVNQSTELGITDGNPLAATAFFANKAYTQFGLQPEPYAAGPQRADPLDQVATPWLRFDFDGGYSHSDTGTSYYAGGDFSFGFKFGDRVGLVLSTPLEYRNVQGADAYTIGEEISLPILLIKPAGNRSLGWMITPTGIVGGAGSVDLASGGLFAGGAITNSLSYQLDGFVFTLADTYSYFHGFPVRVGKYRFDTNLDQEVLENGLKVAKFFGPSLFIDASITYAQFLQRADIREWWSPGVGIGLRFGPYAGLRVAYVGDFSHDFVVSGGNIGFYINY